MIFFVSAVQPAMAQSVLKQLLRASPIKKGEMNYVEIDVGEEGVDALVDELTSLPIGFDRKLVVASNLPTASPAKGKKKKGPTSLDPLINWLANPDPAIDLYILNFGEIDRKSPLVNALLLAKASIKEIKPFTNQEWLRFIDSWFAKRGVTLGSGAADELLDRIDGDYARFLTEGAKLLAYKGQTGTLTRSEVASLVYKPLESNAFALTDALFSADSAKAFKIASDLREGGVEPILLARMMLKQFIFLSQMKYLLSQGLNSDRAADELGVHPYRAKIAAQTVSRLAPGRIDQGIDALHSFEKSVLTGEKNADIAFVECLSEIVQ